MQDGQGDLQRAVSAEPHARRPVTVTSYNTSGETERQAGRQTERDVEGSAGGPASSVLSQGDNSPLTLRVNRGV